MTDDSAGSGGNEKGLDYGSILKVEPKGLPQRLDVGVRKRGIKDALWFLKE